MDKVLIIVGDATETVDTLYPFFRLQEAGFQPVVAAPEKRRYNMVLHEIGPNWDITREFEGYKIDADIAFRDVVPEEYLGIFFSGGRAPEYIRYDEHLVAMTRHFFDADKPVGCVCPWRGDSRLRRLRQGTEDGHRAQVQVRPGGLRRHLRRLGLRRGRQPGERTHLSRPRPVHGPLDPDADRGSRGTACPGRGRLSCDSAGYLFPLWRRSSVDCF